MNGTQPDQPARTFEEASAEIQVSSNKNMSFVKPRFLIAGFCSIQASPAQMRTKKTAVGDRKIRNLRGGKFKIIGINDSNNSLLSLYLSRNDTGTFVGLV